MVWAALAGPRLFAWKPVLRREGFWGLRVLTSQEAERAPSWWVQFLVLLLIGCV